MGVVDVKESVIEDVGESVMEIPLTDDLSRTRITFTTFLLST